MEIWNALPKGWWYELESKVDTSFQSNRDVSITSLCVTLSKAHKKTDILQMCIYKVTHLFLCQEINFARVPIPTFYEIINNFYFHHPL